MASDVAFFESHGKSVFVPGKRSPFCEFGFYLFWNCFTVDIAEHPSHVDVSFIPIETLKQLVDRGRVGGAQ